MEKELPNTSAATADDERRNYILFQARIMQTVMERLGLTDQDFVDRYAEALSNELRSNPAFADAVRTNSPEKDEEVIAALLGPERRAA